MPDADVEFYVWSELNWLHTVTTYIQVNPLWKQVGGSKYVRFSLTRSYAALRAADLDWIIGPGYSSGGYILGENHEKPTWNHEKPGITEKRH